jgi:hypothetical protein
MLRTAQHDRIEISADRLRVRGATGRRGSYLTLGDKSGFVCEFGQRPWYIHENQNPLHKTASLEAAVAHTTTSTGVLRPGLDWLGEWFGRFGRV